MKNPIRYLAILKVALLVVGSMLLSYDLAYASSESGGIYRPQVRIQPTDVPTLQRGYKSYMQNCLSCHSLGLMRYNRISTDLDLSEQQLRDAKLIPSDAKMVDFITTKLSPEDGKTIYGVSPPDLSLKARELGADWIHAMLNSYYQDPTSKTGFNNAIKKNTAMPNLQAGKQGLQKAVYEQHDGKKVLVGLEKISDGSLNDKQFYEETRDLVSFLRYASEPAILKRRLLGWYVIGFLLILLVLTLLLKREYWRDIH